MTIKGFALQHRKEIEAYIKAKFGIRIQTEAELETWVINDDALFLWARKERTEPLREKLA